MDQFKRDISHASKLLLRSRSTTALSVAVLAIAICAGTSVFSLVNSVLLRPLPFFHSGQLVLIWAVKPILNLKLDELPPSVADFSYWRSHSQSLNGLALVRSYLVNAVDNDEPERIGSAKVSAGFFPLLGIKPLLGRWFTEDDDRPGSHVVIISYSLWRRRFGGDPHIVGTKIVLDGFNYEVVGIMPKGFQFPTSSDIKVGYVFSPHT